MYKEPLIHNLLCSEFVELTLCYYLMENDTLMQMIRINYLSQSEILYKIYVRNKKRGLQDSISGIVKTHLDYDPEIDEDIDGTAYPAIEFNDKQKDYIYQNRGY